MAPRLNPLYGIRSAQGAVCDNRISTVGAICHKGVLKGARRATANTPLRAVLVIDVERTGRFT